MLTLLSFLPTELIVLAFLLAALGTVLGIVRLRALGGILLLLLFLPLAGAIADAAFDALPWWAVLVIVIFALFSIGRLVLGFLVGRRAADHAVGHVAGHAIGGVFRLLGRVLLFPFRGVR